jgi:hypothetical protein
MTGKMAGVITAIFFSMQLTKSRWEKNGKELAEVDTLRKCYTRLWMKKLYKEIGSFNGLTIIHTIRFVKLEVDNLLSVVKAE